jgi:uncharacterized protein with FMN-binding domain
VPHKSNKKVANGLVAMSSAALLAVYTAGYVRTRPAADRLASKYSQRPIANMASSTQADPTPPPAAPNRPAPEPPRIVSAPSEPKPVNVTVPLSKLSRAPSKTAEAATSVENAAGPPATEPVAASSAPGAGESATVSPASAPQAEAPAPAPPPPPPPPVWKDGTYTAWGTCRHGDIEATVVIEGGRIISANITNCQTRYACDIIDSLPPKVISRQKNRFDIVGGATESAYAYYGAVYWALDKASK